MPDRTLTIVNKLGLHARAAARLVSTASAFKADIQVTKKGRSVNGKSIMGLMMLAAPKGSEIKIIAEGADADNALDAIEHLVSNFFDEGE